MAAILVDYENVAFKNGMAGVEFLNAGDRLYIFYSKACSKMRADDMQTIVQSGCRFKAVKLVNSRSNALDFYIAAECGALIESGETQIAVISGDKGFHSVVDYVAIRPSEEKVRMVVSPTIEQGLLTLNAKDDLERRRLIRKVWSSWILVRNTRAWKNVTHSAIQLSMPLKEPNTKNVPEKFWTT